MNHSNQLTELLHLNVSEASGIITILDEDKRAELGHGFLQSLMNSMLKNNRSVLCVSFVQIYQHYVAIQKKMGSNLLEYQKSDRFVFVDALTRFTASAYYENTSDLYRPQAVSARPNYVLDACEIDCTFDIISKFLLSHQKCAIVIDGLSTAGLLGLSCPDVMRFLINLHRIVEMSNALAIVNMHSNGSTAEHSFSQLSAATKQSCFLSSLVLQVKGLDTGMSREIDGQVSLIRGPLLGNSEFSPQSLHFKMMDSQIRLLGQGLSSAVL